MNIKRLNGLLGNQIVAIFMLGILSFQSNSYEDNQAVSTTINLNIFSHVTKKQIKDLRTHLNSQNYRIQADHILSIHYLSFSTNSDQSAEKICSDLREIFSETIESCEKDLKQIKLQTTSSECQLNEVQNATLIKEKEECSLVSSYRPNNFPRNLSPYWAQKRIGASFAKELVKSVKKDISTSTPYVVALDDNKSHAQFVSNIVANDSKSGASPGGIPNLDASTDQKLVSILAQMIEKKKYPHIINHSMGFTNSDTSKKAAKTLEKIVKTKGLIYVAASGNDYPDITSPLQQGLAQKSAAIIVGSTSPSGLPSAYSEAYPEVTISAPSNYEILSYNKSGAPHSTFGGTSGAAPLVSGCLRNAEIILEGHLDMALAKTLLTQTATPTVASLNHKKGKRLNGAGMVNCYKMALVAKKVRSQCLKKSSTLKEKCVKEQIKNKKLYSFKEGSKLKDILTQAEKLSFDPENIPCEDRKKIFKELRRQSLIHPENPRLHELLGKIYYGSEKLAMDGDYHLDLSRALKGEKSYFEEENKDFPSYLQKKLIRLQAYHGDGDKIKNKKTGTQVVPRDELYSSIERGYSKKIAHELFKRLEKSKDPKDRAIAADIAPKTDRGRATVRFMSADKSEHVRKASARRVFVFAPLEKNTITRLSQDSSLTVREHFVNNIYRAKSLKLSKKDALFLVTTLEAMSKSIDNKKLKSKILKEKKEFMEKIKEFSEKN